VLEVLLRAAKIHIVARAVEGVARCLKVTRDGQHNNLQRWSTQTGNVTRIQIMKKYAHMNKTGPTVYLSEPLLRISSDHSRQFHVCSSFSISSAVFLVKLGSLVPPCFLTLTAQWAWPELLLAGVGAWPIGHVTALDQSRRWVRTPNIILLSTRSRMKRLRIGVSRFQRPVLEVVADTSWKSGTVRRERDRKSRLAYDRTRKIPSLQ